MEEGNAICDAVLHATKTFLWCYLMQMSIGNKAPMRALIEVKNIIKVREETNIWPNFANVDSESSFTEN